MRAGAGSPNNYARYTVMNKKPPRKVSANKRASGLISLVARGVVRWTKPHVRRPNDGAEGDSEGRLNDMAKT